MFWPGEFHGLYSPWGCKKSDTTFTHSLRKTNFNLSYSCCDGLQFTQIPATALQFQAVPKALSIWKQLLYSPYVQFPNVLAKRERPVGKRCEPRVLTAQKRMLNFFLQAGLSAVAGPGPVLSIHFSALTCRPVSHVVWSCGSQQGRALDEPRGDRAMGASGRQVSHG